MKCPSIIKQAFIGGDILGKVTPVDLKTDVAPIDLKRAIRKHKNLTLPKTKERLAISKAVENLRKGVKKKIPNLTFNYGVDGMLIGNSRMSSPTRYSMTAGHEYGHALDSIIQNNKKFLGGKQSAKSVLNSERSATQHLLKRLPKKIRRKYGPELAHAYDTYVPSAKLNPKKHKKMMNIMTKLRKNFKSPDIKKYISLSDDPITQKGSRLQDRHLLYRRKKIIDSINDRNVLKTVKKRNITKAHNRKMLIQNAKKLKPKDMKILKKEIRHYLKQTRANFGVDTARGVADELRALNKQVAWSKKTKIPGLKGILKKLPKKLKRLMKFIK